MSSEIKTAIKHKQRIYKKLLWHGGLQNDMTSVKAVQYEVSKMIQKAKDDYYFKIRHRLSDPSLRILDCI